MNYSGDFMMQMKENYILLLWSWKKKSVFILPFVNIPSLAKKKTLTLRYLALLKQSTNNCVPLMWEA